MTIESKQDNTTRGQTDKHDHRTAATALSSLLGMLKSGAGETLTALAAGGAIAWMLIDGVSNVDNPAFGAAMSNGTNTQVQASVDPNACASTSPGSEENLRCLLQQENSTCPVGSGVICEKDLDIAQVAWKYFENNYNAETGLVNAVNNYPSTTMWDTGSALAAFITAKDFNMISQKEFDDAMMALLETLAAIELFDGAAPNKVYHAKSRKMVDYGNNEQPLGIGVSVLDLARLISWLNTMQCMHPKYYSAVNSVLSRWDYNRLIVDGQMYGLARDKNDNNIIHPRQEGRLGYEQYAGKIFDRVGFKVPIAASYSNKYRSNTDILGVPIAYDTRDPREFYANNYVVTESYTMDAMELGVDQDNIDLIKNIYEVQRRRWKQTGIPTAISEDNIDRPPYFLYNTIYNAGLKFNTTNSSGKNYDHLKTTSTKAAISMALLFPEEPYSKTLMQSVGSAYDPEGGWYSGVYESGAGYNDVTTANTNGVIMSGLLYKKYGPLFEHCESVAKPLAINSDLLNQHRMEKQQQPTSIPAAARRTSACINCTNTTEKLAFGTQ